MRILLILFIPLSSGFFSVPHYPSRGIRDEHVSAGGSEFPFTFKVRNHVTKQLEDLTRRFKRQRSFIFQKRQELDQLSTQHAMGLAILSPFRIIRLTITALVLAEVLDYYGVLENPQAYKQRVTNVLEQTNIPTIKKKAQDWWREGRQIGGLLHSETYKSPIRTIASWQPKHQFTIGATCGLFFSRLFWYLSYQFLRIILVVYAISEFNQLVKDRSGSSVPYLLKLPPKTDTGLGEIRQAVRKAVGDPGLFAESIPEVIDRYDRGLPGSCKIGLLAGILAGLVVM